jgi:hypothetical protein
VDYSEQIIFLSNLKMSILGFCKLVLKSDGPLLSVLKQKAGKEFKHRLRVAAAAEQRLHKNQQKITCNAQKMETRPTILSAPRPNSPCCLNAYQTIFPDAIFMRPVQKPDIKTHQFFAAYSKRHRASIFLL